MRFRSMLLAAAAISLVCAGVGSAVADRSTINLMQWFEAPGQQTGEAISGSYVMQQRGYYSITARLHMQQLTPTHRYTLWWVVYNNPGACAGGCGPDDLQSAAETGANPAGISFQYGGTAVAGSTGTLSVSTRIIEHAVVGCQSVGPYKGICTPLTDASVAQAMVVLHDHGPATGAPLPPATEMFSAGCKTYSRLGVVVVTYAGTGFDCFSPQSVFLP